MKASISSLKVASLSAATLFIGATALANERPVSVTIEFEQNEVQTEAGITSVLERVAEQAEDACTYARPLIGTPEVDELCVTEVMTQAADLLTESKLQFADASDLIR